MMKSTSLTNPLAKQRLIKSVYICLLGFMAVTGMAQMPIFKRYYIADIPGFEWLGQFFVTHTLHHIGAFLLLTLIFYSIGVYVGLIRRRLQLTASAYIRLALLATIVITGMFRALKNLPDIAFSPGFTMFVDISHLAAMLMLIVCSIGFTVMRCKWLKEKGTAGIETGRANQQILGRLSPVMGHEVGR